MNLLPLLYISIRSCCSLDITSSLVKLVGLVTEDTDDNNYLSMIAKCDINLHLFSLPLQIRELYITINNMRGIDEKINIPFLLQYDFTYLKSYIRTKVQDANYYDLRRVCDNNKSILWTILQRGEE